MSEPLEQGEGPPGPDDAFAEEALALVRERCQVVPVAALVLGSGLADAVTLEPCHQFAFETLPGFPLSSVPGHDGRLVIGEAHGVPVAVFFGRVHLYEGRGIGSTTLIPRLARALGAETIVLTNAAGGLDPSMHVGTLMLIEDHLNFMGHNPLAGWRYPGGVPAFVDLSDVYERGLRVLAGEIGRREGIRLDSGVYAAVAGPSYETSAERAFLALAGARAVGMSTVPEAVAAKALGLSVLGVSCITNVVGGSDSYEEVLQAASKAAPALQAILRGVLTALPDRASRAGEAPG
jgi:purine-nucleoside phosphorylase